ncbi:PilZ domain-containing protein [Pseudomonas sp. LFM046]|uniref:PilZ domain-containing protein n=1 Tax=Pseudomonas sp. LFM046 TaxID=1608357 RepID=UPI0005CFAFD9|nr:PilZ domain-containing protein [Pseudomonas sp. LFM046]
MRQFLRHPTDMPVELVPHKGGTLPLQRLHDISLGGVACNSPRAFRRGTTLQLMIPALGSQACYSGTVAWCRKEGTEYMIGIAFIDEENLFRARMVEQICLIEQYRKQREQETGTALDSEAVAQEWIARHAADFAPV